MLDLITLISAAGLQQELTKAKSETGEVIREARLSAGQGRRPRAAGRNGSSFRRRNSFRSVQQRFGCASNVWSESVAFRECPYHAREACLSILHGQVNATESRAVA
ncbi:unnamed protein product [Effrenium voratum]|nr:unnamed protein product [Effrenium voratum]